LSASKNPGTTAQQRRVQRVRTITLTAAGLLVAAVLGYGLIYSLGSSAPDEIAEGEHFRLVDNPAPVDPRGPIRVTEFFSYGCIHCKNFDPMIEEWRRQLPDDVVFERAPVAFSPIWTLLGQTYYALEGAGALEGNHQRLFRAIHDDGLQFLSREMIADYVDGHGIDRAAFVADFDSAGTRRALTDAARRASDWVITGVPTVVVGDRYVISPKLSRRDTLLVADRLIAQLRDERTAPTTVE